MIEVKEARGGGRSEDEEEEKVRVEVLKHAVMEGKLPREFFVDLMDMLLLQWDEERKRM